MGIRWSPVFMHFFIKPTPSRHSYGKALLAIDEAALYNGDRAVLHNQKAALRRMKNRCVI